MIQKGRLHSAQMRNHKISSCLIVEMDKNDDKEEDAKEHHDDEVEGVDNVGVKLADQFRTETGFSLAERGRPQQVFLFFPPFPAQYANKVNSSQVG